MSSAGGGGEEGRGKVTFDLTLEIIHIIWELLSQIQKSAPDADIMQINASSKKCGLFCSRSYFTYGLAF